MQRRQLLLEGAMKRLHMLISFLEALGERQKSSVIPVQCLLSHVQPHLPSCLLETIFSYVYLDPKDAFYRWNKKELNREVESLKPHSFQFRHNGIVMGLFLPNQVPMLFFRMCKVCGNYKTLSNILFQMNWKTVERLYCTCDEDDEQI